MSLPITVGLIALVIFIMISRFLSEKALKVLSGDEKAKLIDDFSNFRKYSQTPCVSRK